MKRYLATVALLALLTAFVGGASFTPALAQEEAVAVDKEKRAEEEASPLKESYELWGWNVFRYYYYLYKHLFVGYPWVVRVAYGVVLLCCAGFVLLFCAMVVDVRIRRRNKKKYDWLRETYLEKLKGICYAEVENLPTEEISNRIGYKPEKWKDWELLQWAYIFMEVSTFTNTQNPNLTNIQRAMRLVGMNEYVEKRLTHGKRKTRMRVIQFVRLTNMQLSNSLVAHLLNSNDTQLRKASRLYYMCTSKDDPYAFFEEESKKSITFSAWDEMELHGIFEKIREAGRTAPSFVPLIQKIENPKIVAFLIQEVAYWGTDSDMRFLMRYFESSNYLYRQAAFMCMGVRKFEESEEPMRKVFSEQTEVLRRSILNAVLKIDSRRCVPFFVEAYQGTSSGLTKRTALRCLWMYGPQGRSAFDQLKMRASENEAVLFEHVANPLINHDAL